MKPSSIEVAEVTGGVEPVDREEVFTAAPAHAAQGMRTPKLNHANCSRRHRPAAVGVDDPDFHAGKRLPQLPQADRGMSVSAGKPQYGPNASVMPNSFARAPGSAR